MTIKDCIERFDLLYPNALPYVEKLNMLSCLDGRIKSEIHSLYTGESAFNFEGYTSSTPKTTVLCVAFPYDDIYIKYLASQSDCINGDTARYINSCELFNRSFAEYAASYNRTHMREGVKAVNM